LLRVCLLKTTHNISIFLW